MSGNKYETYVRLDTELRDELKRIADLESRSLNAQIEYFLRKSVERFNKKTQRESDEKT